MENFHPQQDTFRYVSFQKILPAQIRYSQQHVAEKVAKAIAKGAAIWNSTEKRWAYKYNQGTSILSEKNTLPVVRSSFGYVLADGHHDVLSSIHFKAEMIPIKVIEDLSHLDFDQFWATAEQKGWAYLRHISGQKSLPPSSFHQLIDDPNRYFAAITACKFSLEVPGGIVSIGAEYPLWVKVNKDIPFIEFKIADALFAKNFIYHEETMGNPPTDESIEKARRILLEANIPGLRVTEKRIHFEQIKLNTLHKDE